MRGGVQNAVGDESIAGGGGGRRGGGRAVISHPCSQGPGTSGLSPPCKSLNSPKLFEV